jgi:hypothetical protein
MQRIDEIDYFQKQIKHSFEFFEEWLYPSVYENLTYKGIPLRKSVFFDKLDKLSHDKDDYKHNCLPCNLTDGANLIRYFLKSNFKCENIRYFVNIYSILLYQQAERFGVIYVKLGYKKEDKNEFDWSKFPSLIKIKHWANFFKHPKSSMFIHHPTFHIESFPDNPNFMFDGIIDSEFVKKYFAGPNLNSKLEILLLNKEFKIFFPDIISFTKLLCDESDYLINIINSKNENIEKLKFFRKKSF